MIENDLPDEQVNVRIASCDKCNAMICVAVAHKQRDDSMKQFGKYAMEGYNIQVMPLLEYRKVVNDWPMFCKQTCVRAIEDEEKDVEKFIIRRRRRGSNLATEKEAVKSFLAKRTERLFPKPVEYKKGEYIPGGFATMNLNKK